MVGRGDIPTIEGFDQLSVIGDGGSATVYAATQTTMHRRVAIKVLDAGPQARAFRRELLALGTLSDIPHIVPVHSIESTSDGRPAIVMPLMETSIAGIVRAEGRCSIERVLRWASQLAPALDEAHRRGIVHRDIKPENVLIAAFDDAYLADFGIADLEEMAAGTVTKMSMTPAYAPPEQVQGSVHGSPAGDVYSLAATLYAALSGRPPFGSTADGGVLGLSTRIANQPPPPIVGVSAGVQAVLGRGLAKLPAHRPPSARELVDALTRAVAGASTPPPASDSTGSGAARGPDLTTGLFLSDVEARLGGVHPVVVAELGSDTARTVPVRVPAGVADGRRLRLDGMGGAGRGGGPPGDLRVLVHVEGESRFARKGANLTVTVPVGSAVLEEGGSVAVGTLDGGSVRIRVPGLTPSGKTFRVKGGGTASAFGTGDLMVTVVEHGDLPPTAPPPPAPPPPPPSAAPLGSTAPRRPMPWWKRGLVIGYVVTAVLLTVVGSIVWAFEARDRSESEACRTERKTIATALYAYRAIQGEDGVAPVSFGDLLDPPDGSAPLLRDDPSERFRFSPRGEDFTAGRQGTGACSGF